VSCPPIADAEYMYQNPFISGQQRVTIPYLRRDPSTKLMHVRTNVFLMRGVVGEQFARRLLIHPASFLNNAWVP
jgi:hypothetical protein